MEPIARETGFSKALHEAAQAACMAYGVPKIYFAQALGRRLHHLAGFGEATYLPAVKEYLGYGIWAFIEGSDPLTPERKAGLLADLKQIVSTCAELNKAKSATTQEANGT